MGDATGAGSLTESPRDESGSSTTSSSSDDTAVGLPGANQRWRCGACGNLTRFDVVRTATTREYWHLDLSGEPQVEETTTLAHAVSSVLCRWCGRNDAIEVVARPGGTPP